MAKGGRISFDEIMKLWSESRAKAMRCMLMLVLDSCHSGRWVELAEGRGLKDVVVQAACSSGEAGGYSGQALQPTFVHALSMAHLY
jgi:hypothetical protein